MSLLVRWTIGPVREAGFECLKLSVLSFLNLYKADLFVCHNGLSENQFDFISKLPVNLIRQEDQSFVGDKPVGVAWKLTPPRLALDCHEIFIDNDLILTEKISEIDDFLSTNKSTLLIEAESRHYGRFENKVPIGYNINSGLFGLPPNFDLGNYVKLWGKWGENCPNLSRTWDEQGLVASALLNHNHFLIVPDTKITNCYSELLWAPGMHFVGLNRNAHHRPFAEYRASSVPFLL